MIGCSSAPGLSEFQWCRGLAALPALKRIIDGLESAAATGHASQARVRIAAEHPITNRTEDELGTHEVARARASVLNRPWIRGRVYNSGLIKPVLGGRVPQRRISTTTWTFT